MKDAFGGIFNFVFIVLFLLIVSGILAFIVSYTKAFKMKNYIISSIENFEGRENCFSAAPTGGNSCSSIISDKAKSIGYTPVINNCPTGYNLAGNGLFCYCPLKKNYSGEVECDSGNLDRREKYRVIAQIDINIPIVRDILSFSFFRVSGDTKYMN